MTHYSVLNNKDLLIILSPYGVEKVQFYKILSGGSENTNYLVKTETNAYVLTISEQKSSTKMAELADFLEYLNLKHFTTSKIVKTLNGSLTTQWNNKPVFLKEYIEGDIIEDLSKNLLIYLGSQMAQLHQINAPDYLPKKLNYGIENFNEVRVYAPKSSFYTWLKTTQRYIQSHINSDLPKALIHSDIFYNNIVVNKDGKQATIMDFEEACYNYRVFDIGMMIIGTCSEGKVVNFDKVACLLVGYQQEITLLPLEINALQAFTVYAATATAFWRHQNFNYINVTSEKKDHYLEMKQLADFVMSISANDFKRLLEGNPGIKYCQLNK
jgi:homoserine kinase type II